MNSGLSTGKFVCHVVKKDSFGELISNWLVTALAALWSSSWPCVAGLFSALVATDPNVGSGLEDQSQEVGSERKSEKEEVQFEILAHQVEQSHPEELQEGRGEVVDTGSGTSESVRSACSENCAHRKGQN